MRFHCPILIVSLALFTAEVNGGTTSGPTPPASSLAPYEEHLQALVSVVDACAAKRNDVACDPGRVGADDSVVLPGLGTREVRYELLRNLLERARQPDGKQGADAAKTGGALPENNPAQTGAGNGEQPVPARPPLDALQPQDAGDKPASVLLTAAVARLKVDLDEAQHWTASRRAGHQSEHGMLKQVLAQGIYSDLGEEPGRNRVLEKLGGWINVFFDGLNRVGMRMPWLGRVLMVLFFVVVGALLIWSMIQNERRLRLQLLPEGLGVPDGAPSARGWELWWRDAESAAKGSQWREAVHFAYWASIARLEQKRLWPADKARTPREYPRLLKADDPRRAGLLQLTRSFERTWYGGRDADEATCRSAMGLARELMDAGGKR